MNFAHKGQLVQSSDIFLVDGLGNLLTKHSYRFCDLKRSCNLTIMPIQLFVNRAGASVTPHLKQTGLMDPLYE